MLIRIGLGALNTFVVSLLWRSGFELLNIRSDWAVVGGYFMIVGTGIYFVWSMSVIFPAVPNIIHNFLITKSNEKR